MGQFIICFVLGAQATHSDEQLGSGEAEILKLQPINLWNLNIITAGNISLPYNRLKNNHFQHINTLSKLTGIASGRILL